MATSLEYVRIIAPEFVDKLDATVNTFIDLANNFIDVNLYANPELALAYMASSLMYQQNQSASGSSNGLDLTMEKEGDLTRQYGRNSTSSNGTTKDIYLQMLDTLTKQFAGSTILTRYGI